MTLYYLYVRQLCRTDLVGFVFVVVVKNAFVDDRINVVDYWQGTSKKFINANNTNTAELAVYFDDSDIFKMTQGHFIPEIFATPIFNNKYAITIFQTRKSSITLMSTCYRH